MCAAGPSPGGLECLASPYGLVSHVARLPTVEGDARFAVYSASVGNLGFVLDGQTAAGWAHDPAMGNIDGAGGDAEPQRAAFLAVAESLERYSSCAWRPDRVIWATARELGDE